MTLQAYIVSNATEKAQVAPQDLMATADRLAVGGALTIVELHDAGVTRTILREGRPPTGDETAVTFSPEAIQALATPETRPVVASEPESSALPTPPSTPAPSPTTTATPATTIPTLGMVATDLAARNAAPAPTTRSTWSATVVDHAAASTVTALHAALTAEGFALPTPYYATGTLLADAGVRNFAAKKAMWEGSPRVGEACTDMAARVRAEGRRNVEVALSDLRMGDDGRIVRVNGDHALALPSATFGQLATRIGIPGGASYLRECPPDLRAHNFNHWAQRSTGEAVLGVRRVNGAPQIYRVVSDRYGECNADTIAECVAEAAKAFPDARGHVVYDADEGRTSIEVEFMSPIAPDRAVVGEVWRATVRITGDDTGGGSIRGGGGVSMALCLNFTYADAAGHTFSIRHLGNARKVVYKLRQGIAASLKQIRGLVTQWGFACEDDVMLASRSAADILGLNLPVRARDAMPWLFQGIVEQELVPVVGRKSEAVAKLARWHDEDTSSARSRVDVSRASIVNAFTRYAHEEVSDPWMTDEIQRKASALLWSTKPIIPATFTNA